MQSLRIKTRGGLFNVASAKNKRALITSMGVTNLAAEAEVKKAILLHIQLTWLPKTPIKIGGDNSELKHLILALSTFLLFILTPKQRRTYIVTGPSTNIGSFRTHSINESSFLYPFRLQRWILYSFNTFSIQFFIFILFYKTTISSSS